MRVNRDPAVTCPDDPDSHLRWSEYCTVYCPRSAATLRGSPQRSSAAFSLDRGGIGRKTAWCQESSCSGNLPPRTCGPSCYRSRNGRTSSSAPDFQHIAWLPKWRPKRCEVRRFCVVIRRGGALLPGRHVFVIRKQVGDPTFLFYGKTKHWFVLHWAIVTHREQDDTTSTPPTGSQID